MTCWLKLKDAVQDRTSATLIDDRTYVTLRPATNAMSEAILMVYTHSLDNLGAPHPPLHLVFFKCIYLFITSSIWFGSGLWYYITLHPFLPQGFPFLCVCLFAWLCSCPVLKAGRKREHDRVAMYLRKYREGKARKGELASIEIYNTALHALDHCHKWRL